MPKSKIVVRFNESSLEMVNVKIVDKTEIVLKCKTCNLTWSPNKQTNGRLPRGWWKCPNGCNKQ